MKIVFTVSDYDVGGITSSLQNLSRELIIRGHEIYIVNLPHYVNKPYGFDDRIHFINLTQRASNWDISLETLKQARRFNKIKIFFLGLLKKLFNKLGIWNKYIFFFERIHGTYDVSIAFRQSPTDYYFARYKVNAKRYIGFYHVDPDFAVHTNKLDNCLCNMDKIACVSNAMVKKMKRHYPHISNRFVTVYNIFDSVNIVNKMGEDNIKLSDGFNIVTVSRIDFLQKKLDIIPLVANRLKTNNIKFKWYIIGDGPDYIKLERLIKKYEVGDVIELLGAKLNPFPYINKADLFALTSECESYGMVVVEALICGTPVLASYYPALMEILDEGINGQICNCTVDAFYTNLKELILNRKKYQVLKDGAKKYNYSSDLAYNQFMELIK